MLFEVGVIDTFEVPPGFVAVLRSNIGEELDRPESKPVPVSTDPDFDQILTAKVESLLTTTRDRRGIWRNPLAPGRYNLNSNAFTAYLVPTSAIMVDWASSERPSSPSMSRPSATPAKDRSDYPYLTEDSAQGAEFFKFNQLKVASKDGFQLEVDVRMVIRILPDNAAFAIARFGSVFNLIQQIVHPLIDAEFRNNAGQKQALEFVRSRSQLQEEAVDKARQVFRKYMVEAQNLLISYIQVDEALLATQTKKEIAVQAQAQYTEPATAEERRIALQAMTARANLQPQVVRADLQIVINENNAKAAVKRAEGIRDSTRIEADGNAAAIRRVGEAQGDAYHAQADVIGADKVALIKTVDLLQAGEVRITPDTRVVGGSGAEGTNTMFSAYLATLLSQKNPGGAAKPYSPSTEKDYVSPLTTAPIQDPSIPLPTGPADPSPTPSARPKDPKPRRPSDMDGDEQDSVSRLFPEQPATGYPDRAHLGPRERPLAARRPTSSDLVRRRMRGLCGPDRFVLFCGSRRFAHPLPRGRQHGLRPAARARCRIGRPPLWAPRRGARGGHHSVPGGSHEPPRRLRAPRCRRGDTRGGHGRRRYPGYRGLVGELGHVHGIVGLGRDHSSSHVLGRGDGRLVQ